MSTRRAPKAGAGTNRVAQLLAYDGPVIERKASEYPVSSQYALRSEGPAPSPEYIQLVNELQAKLAEWAPKVRAAYDRHLQNGLANENPYQEQDWRGDVQAYLTLMRDMDDRFTNMARYITPQNYMQVLAEKRNNLPDILIELIIGDREADDARVRYDLLTQAIYR